MNLFDTNTTFERQLFAKAAQKHIPLYGVLELLPLCNLNCDMCYVHLSKQEMQSQGRLRSLDEWISLAKQMKDGFDKTIRGIELLKKYKIDVKINGSLVKKNFHDRMEIIDIGEKYDIPVRIDTYMYPSVRERTTPFNFHERLNPEDAAKARVEILHREMGDELFEQYAKQTIYLAEHTEEGDACPGHMTCRAGQSSFVVNWQGMLRSCIVLDQPSYDAFDTTDDFMTLWNKIVKETEEIKTSMECNQCKLRHVCNTCAAAAVAECGDSEGVSKYLCEYTKETVRNLKEFY